MCVEKWKKEKGKSIVSEQLLQITILYLKLRFNEDLSSYLYIFPQIFDEWTFSFSILFTSRVTQISSCIIIIIITREWSGSSEGLTLCVQS